MASTLESFAAFLQDPGLAAAAFARRDRLRLHIADTLAMIFRGGSLAEARTAETVGSRVVFQCASSRLTEGDDIHLTSCTTPGSVVVPAALELASRGAFPTFGAFATAVLAGYETLIRIGYAIDGPKILARQIWPTLFGASSAAAAVACRAWKLDATATAAALATALAASTGIAPPAMMMANSSRWIALGCAVESGIAAAAAAREGALGDGRLLERRSGRVAGVAVSQRRLLRQLGRQFLFDDTGLKPYPVARQALAAVEACRELAGNAVRGISRIDVRVAAAQARIIDQPVPPANRMQSIAGVQYQIALALLAPDRLSDIQRTPPFQSRAIQAMAAKVRVRADASLDDEYPETWPARVTVHWKDKRKSASLAAPRGDVRNPLGWEDVLKKSAPDEARLERIRDVGWDRPVPQWCSPGHI